jgi:hypothetical protein
MSYSLTTGSGASALSAKSDAMIRTSFHQYADAALRAGHISSARDPAQFGIERKRSTLRCPRFFHRESGVFFAAHPAPGMCGSAARAKDRRGLAANLRMTLSTILAATAKGFAWAAKSRTGQCGSGRRASEGPGLDGARPGHRNRPMRRNHPHDPLRSLISLLTRSVASIGRTRTRTLSAVVLITVNWTVSLHQVAATETDLFQEAVNYVFTGTTDPLDGPEIVDRKSCIVLMHDPKYKRYIRYHLKRFKMDTANFSKIYAGSRTLYDLEVAGDDVILEYLDMDKTTVSQAYKSAQIPLPGNIDQTQKALKIIFTDYCRADQLETPF